MLPLLLLACAPPADPPDRVLDSVVGEEISSDPGSGAAPPPPIDAPRSIDTPNLLVIVADDVGYADTSIAAFADSIAEFEPGWRPDVPTPNLAALAAGGRSYTRYHSNGPVCSPTRAALMTGLQPHDAGIWQVLGSGSSAELIGQGLKPGAQLLPDLLRQAGYATAAVGKWHIGPHTSRWGLDGGDCLEPDTPNYRGFDSYLGFLDGEEDYEVAAACNNLARAEGHGADLVFYGEEDCPYEGQHLTEVFTDEALAQHQRLEATEKPWFLFVAYTAPHKPVDEGAAWLREAAETDPALAALVEGCEAIEGRGELGSDLCLLMSHLDAQIGRLLELVDEETYVVFVSDNGGDDDGGSLNTPFSGGKTELTGGGLVVPLVIRGPGIPPGTASDALVTTADLFPTLLDLAGASWPSAQLLADYPATCDVAAEYRQEPLSGLSLRDALLSDEPSPRAQAIFEHRGRLALVEEGDGARWKLIGEVWDDWALCDPGWELYDIASDPAESLDLSSIYPDRAAAMAAEIEAWVLGLPQHHEQIARYACCLELSGEGCDEACGSCE